MNGFARYVPGQVATRDDGRSSMVAVWSGCGGAG